MRKTPSDHMREKVPLSSSALWDKRKLKLTEKIVFGKLKDVSRMNLKRVGRVCEWRHMLCFQWSFEDSQEKFLEHQQNHLEFLIIPKKVTSLKHAPDKLQNDKWGIKEAKETQKHVNQSRRVICDIFDLWATETRMKTHTQSTRESIPGTADAARDTKRHKANNSC